MDFLRSAIKCVAQDKNIVEERISDKAVFFITDYKMRITKRDRASYNKYKPQMHSLDQIKISLSALEGTCKDWNSEQVSELATYSSAKMNF